MRRRAEAQWPSARPICRFVLRTRTRVSRLICRFVLRTRTRVSRLICRFVLRTRTRVSRLICRFVLRTRPGRLVTLRSHRPVTSGCPLAFARGIWKFLTGYPGLACAVTVLQSGYCR